MSTPTNSRQQASPQPPDTSRLCKVEIVQIADFAGVRIRGNIDESFDPNALKVSSATVVIDLSRINRITSFGIREWISMVRRLQEEKRKFYFFNCPVQLLNQFNMISGFGGSGKIVTFLAPYLCEECDEEREVMVDLIRDHESIANFEPSPANCPVCGLPMVFDDTPHDFFSYVAAQGIPEFPANGIEFCRRSGILIGRGLGTSLRIRKAVSKSVTVLKLHGIIDSAMNRRAFQGLEGEVVVDLSNVEEVDTEGAQKLQKATAAIKGTSSHVWFIDASAAFVRALNNDPSLFDLIPDIVSFRAPYFCDNCKRMQSVSIDRLDNWSVLSRSGLPKAGCPKCRTPLAPRCDSQYLSLLSKQPPEQLTEDAVAAARDTDRFLLEASLESSISDSSPSSGGTAGHDGVPVGVIAPGTTLGKYTLERLLGTGGMAEVYLARQVGPSGFQKRVVVKRVLPHLARDGEFIDQFLDEARLSAYFSHPNIVQVFELVQEGTEYLIAMEYVEGCDLATLARTTAKTKQQVPIPVAIRIVYDLLQGLDYAHEQKDIEGHPLGVVHRDVSLSNILVSKDGVVKLVDFGIAKASSKIQLTKPGFIKGKVYYMAPEQFQEQDLDRRVDIYGAGVVLFELLTRSRLFKGETETSVLYSIVNKEPPLPSDRRQDVDSKLDKIVSKALVKDRDQRYLTAREFALVLQRYCADKFHGLPGIEAIRDWQDEINKLRSTAMADRKQTAATGQKPATATGQQQADPAKSEEDDGQIFDDKDTLEIKRHGHSGD